MSRPRVAVIGLDCAAPSLVFDRFRGVMPNVARLMERGAYGALRSCDPPITVPAWSCMTSSKDPGQLGIYGFRNRRNHAYGDLGIADATAVREKRVWDLLSAAGKRCTILGVPGTFPPPQLPGGRAVGCFLTPSTDAAYTHPASLKDEIRRVVGDYVLDVEDFRNQPAEATLAKLHDMTRKRFALARHLVASDDWDFLMMVEMGPDRIHHVFWRHHSETHRAHDPASPFRHAIRDYYAALDREIGALLAALPPSTSVLVVSDHGVQDMQGGIAVNEWMLDRGWLALRGPRPSKPTPFAKLDVDWTRTRAWGEGGYYARIFMNVEGREPQGTIPAADREKVRAELARELAAIPDDRGRPLPTRVLRPEELYRAVNGVAPDLMAYFGDLTWRSIGTVGHGRHAVLENDTGADDANHHPDGIFVGAGPGLPAGGGRLAGLRIYDVAPTVLRLFGMDPPADMIGRAIGGGRHGDR